MTIANLLTKNLGVIIYKLLINPQTKDINLLISSTTRAAMQIKEQQAHREATETDLDFNCNFIVNLNCHSNIILPFIYEIYGC